jgi:hypothetical protein
MHGGGGEAFDLGIGAHARCARMTYVSGSSAMAQQCESRKTPTATIAIGSRDRTTMNLPNRHMASFAKPHGVPGLRWPAPCRLRSERYHQL